MFVGRRTEGGSTHCDECDRPVGLVLELDSDSDRPLTVCSVCLRLALFRGSFAWLWVNPAHRLEQRRLALPLDDLSPIPAEMADLIHEN